MDIGASKQPKPLLTPPSSPPLPLRACQAISPYGRTKLFQEDMFRDLAVSDKDWRILLLR